MAKALHRSLLDLFDPPDKMIGSFGWICGYSADPVFMEEAVQRFTQAAKAARMAEGGIALALIMDPSCPQITGAAGVLHLPAFESARNRYRLLHAKVALLLFSSRDGSENYVVRLVVSTGNWTMATTNESIDLYWSFDWALGHNGNDQQQRADLIAAWGMMKWVRENFDHSLLYRETADLADREDGKLSEILEALKSPDTQPRFFDNRKTGLLEQIVKRVPEGKRNQLVMGSGFFEGGSSSALPKVPVQIVDQLKDKLSRSVTISLVVDPEKCQCIAASRDAIDSARWCILEGRVPASFGAHKRLHAKFIFSANTHGSKRQNCRNNWLYFGSGNLTNPGLVSRSGTYGNLEAGVFMSDQKLFWSGEDDAYLLSHKLPFEIADETAALSQLFSGDMEPDFEQQFFAPPVPYLIWHPSAPESSARLSVPNGHKADGFDLIGPGGQTISKVGDEWVWDDTQPSIVVLQQGNRSHDVLVVDALGRIGTGHLPPVTFDEAMSRLVNFPALPEEGDDEQDAAESSPETPFPFNSGRIERSGVKHSSVRPLLEAIETIAEIQSHITEQQWPKWCRRLENVLVGAAASDFVRDFYAFKSGIDPLDILLRREFRPLFAETSKTEAGKRYVRLIEQVRKEWQTRILPMEVP